MSSTKQMGWGLFWLSLARSLSVGKNAFTRSHVIFWPYHVTVRGAKGLRQHLGESIK